MRPSKKANAKDQSKRVEKGEAREKTKRKRAPVRGAPDLTVQ
jgi:hypothetical protein